MNVSEAVLRELVECGVEACFANPGTSEMHLVASFDRVGGLRPILGLFEGVCTGAADGYARMKEKPAATLLHLGPGLGNGFANLHNAKRAHSRVINIVGDHATYHRKYDAPLQSDIHSIAKPVSDWIGDPATPAQAVSLARQAVEVAMRPNGGMATMIVPADIAWTTMQSAAQHEPLAVKKEPIDHGRIKEAARALKSGEPAVLFVGGRAGLERNLRLAAAIAAKTGAKLMGDTFVPRTARGRGRPKLDRLPYFGEMALAQMKDFRHCVLVGTKAPVAFFAYPEKPSTFLSANCVVHEPWSLDRDVSDVLEALAAETGAKPADAVLAQSSPVAIKPGALTAENFGQAFASLLPENAIVADEAVTNGLWAFLFSDGAAPHDWLTLTGGAIGYGIPVSIGAAVACPDRPVINLQADGSAAYTIQGLWTAARENLHIVTVLFNNRSYAILNMELDRVGATAQSERSRSLLSLDRPAMDFTSIAKGFGVPAVRAADIDVFQSAFKRALAEPGPHLIEAVM
jgi:acetolactate synthase-1/2/3 large subunit